jgi:hypothetical protein
MKTELQQIRESLNLAILMLPKAWANAMETAGSETVNKVEADIQEVKQALEALTTIERDYVMIKKSDVPDVNSNEFWEKIHKKQGMDVIDIVVRYGSPKGLDEIIADRCQIVADEAVKLIADAMGDE